jgi:hypothetical protein
VSGLLTRFRTGTRICIVRASIMSPIVFVELPKFVDKPSGLRSRLEKWLDKVERDRITALTEAERRGIEKGIEKGETKKAQAVARAMLANGCEHELIRAYTDLPLEEILKLKDKA